MNPIELYEPDCCGMPRSGNHAFDCPLALSEDCDDCAAPPGVACLPYCSSLLDSADDDLEPEPEVWLPFLAVLDVDPVAEFIRWNWIIGLCRPLVQRGLIAAFWRSDLEPLTVPVSADEPHRFHGWIDARGLALADRHAGLPARSVLLRRTHRDALLAPTSTGVVLPVLLRLPPRPALPLTGRCVCGHGPALHSDAGFGCGMSRPDSLWCGCLSYRTNAALAIEP